MHYYMQQFSQRVFTQKKTNIFLNMFPDTVFSCSISCVIVGFMADSVWK
jgi:hypothetical protein